MVITIDFGKMFVLIAGDVRADGIRCPSKRQKCIERGELTLISYALFTLTKVINFFYETKAFLWGEQLYFFHDLFNGTHISILLYQ